VFEQCGVVAGVLGHIDLSDCSALTAVFIDPEVLYFGRIPGAECKTQRAACSEDSCFVGCFGVDAAALLVIVGQAGVEFHVGGAVLFDVGFLFGVAEDFYAGFGKGGYLFELRAVVKQAEVKGEVVDTPVNKWASDGVFFLHCPFCVRVVFDEGSSHKAVVVDVVNFADVAIVNHSLNEAEFRLEASVPAGAFDDDKLSVFLDLADEPIHLGAVGHHRFFKDDVFFCVHGGFGNFEVHERRRTYNDGIDAGVFKDVMVVGGAVGDGIFFELFGEVLFVGVGEPEDVDSFVLFDAFHVEVGNHAGTDEADVNLFHNVLLCPGKYYSHKFFVDEFFVGGGCIFEVEGFCRDAVGVYFAGCDKVHHFGVVVGGGVT